MALPLGAAVIAAQDLACAETVERAIASVEERCAGLARNDLCDSHPAVAVSFFDGTTAAEASPPARRAALAEISSVSTSGLDSAQGQWGIAILHLDANTPQTYDGPGVIALVAGDAQISSETDPAAVVAMSPPVSTAALADATLYKKPGIIPAPLETVPADEILLVDAWDDSGDWLRVVNDGAVSWVAAEDVARLNAMAALPRLRVGAAFPFQALSLSNATSFPECAEAEPMIAIQTPPGAPMNLTINGVDMRLDGMVTIQQVHYNALSLTAHRGEATTIFGGTARQGESVIGILGQRADGKSEVRDWSGALPASEAELARGQRAQDALNALARANGWAEQATFSAPPELVHIVAPGESLYSIARLHDTSVALIILANLAAEPLRLHTGMTLIVPEPGSGFVGPGTVPLDATLED